MKIDRVKIKNFKSLKPEITYPLSELNVKNNLIGLKGEYTAHYLAENKNKNLLIEKLKHKESKTNQLLENTSLWLNEISENIEIDATVNPSQNNVTLTYKYNYENGTTNKYNPLNVGFDITYVLPIIVAILKSKPNDSSIYYFRKDIDKLDTKIDTINIDEYGNIDNYPKSFFDEWDNKLDELLGL